MATGQAAQEQGGLAMGLAAQEQETIVGLVARQQEVGDRQKLRLEDRQKSVLEA